MNNCAVLTDWACRAWQIDGTACMAQRRSILSAYQQFTWNATQQPFFTSEYLCGPAATRHQLRTSTSSASAYTCDRHTSLSPVHAAAVTVSSVSKATSMMLQLGPSAGSRTAAAGPCARVLRRQVRQSAVSCHIAPVVKLAALVTRGLHVSSGLISTWESGSRRARQPARVLLETL